MSTNEFHTPASGDASPTLEHLVFGGLTPRVNRFEPSCENAAQTLRRTVMGGLPLLMTGSLATGVVASPHALDLVDDAASATNAERSDQRPGFQARLNAVLLPLAHSVISVARPDLPSTYVVQTGDSVSAIADRFNIPTPAVLTLNGLTWNAILHEGQVLKLTADPTKKKAASPARIGPDGYTVQPGESVSVIAARLGISTAALLKHNELDSDAVIFAGHFLKIPAATLPTVSSTPTPSIPVFAPGPGILLASHPNTQRNDANDANGDDATAVEGGAQKIFDAADIDLVEKPALVTVRIAPEPPKAKPAPAPVAEEKAPAPVAQASTPGPEKAEPASTVGQPTQGAITPLNEERRANAAIVVAVGRELGVPDYGIVIALATAMQESSLRNIDWGDRDSVGLYQQRPSTGWGSVEQILDQAHATRLFFGGPSNPNNGKTRGLLDISGWQTMALTVAAQRVQISAYPDAYAKWEPSAWAWLYELS